MRRKLFVRLAILVALVFSFALGCGPKKGTLRFDANGEDFVRQGFVSKDGWRITFDHVYVTLAEITGYQTDPPYDPHEGSGIEAKVKAILDGVHTVDLAEGGEDAPPIAVGEVQKAAVGHYNALSWEMVRAPSGAAPGYSLVIVGKAKKDGRAVDFTIKVEQEYDYACGEYVGDERKGILDVDGGADLEMTFHFDHIFGDAETPLDDDLNVGAVGFEPFASISEDGKLDVDMVALKGRLPPQDYQKLVSILPTLGHVGEGHCHCEAS